ncbi:histidine phosphatase family protein [Nostocoides sp. HKS02]|uniref:histidine phosphatase family protein n=1 Tax=Nostocoides sp. HKS02 TaxID=1813880 RepID=UPI0012B4A5B4|nr:histidine phosphatase family protein [Tetrasphaera sp. HKS02]QGN57327.1 histidine phosphatase family protein [Tetrasphaera sp. HKS02]
MTSQPRTPAVPTGRLVLLRHGETQWSKTGRHTGRTDIPLTEHGEQLARAAGALLGSYDFVLALASPLERARRSAALAGLTPQLDDDLLEWDYGGYEGLTTPQIRAELGYDWTVFENGVPPGQTPGETVEEVAARASRVVQRAVAAMADGDVALVGHGHCLRVLATVFMRQEPRMGAQLLLDAGSVSVLQFEREVPAIRVWNHGPAVTAAHD